MLFLKSLFKRLSSLNGIQEGADEPIAHNACNVANESNP